MPLNRVDVRLVIQALRDVRFVTRTFEVWRLARLGYEPRDPSGSRRTPGRWHNHGTTAALYTSLDFPTAKVEYRFRKVDPFPATTVQLRVTVDHLLDLTDRAIASFPPFSLARCLADLRVSFLRGVVMGDAAVALGASGLLAPCMRGSAACLCLYVIHEHAHHITELQRFTITE